MRNSIIILFVCSYLYAQNNEQYVLNVPVNFEKTHFIVGYTPAENKLFVPESKPSVRQNKNKIPSTKTYFTTVHDVRQELESCLKAAKKSIYIATFALTDTKITELLIQAHNAGIQVTIITDKERMNDRYSKIDTLVRNKIPVFYYTHDLNPNLRQKRAKGAHMHHKFIIIDETTLIFGSLNLTKAGQEENIENITITTKPQVVADYFAEFKRLQSLSTQVKR